MNLKKDFMKISQISLDRLSHKIVDQIKGNVFKDEDFQHLDFDEFTKNVFTKA